VILKLIRVKKYSALNGTGKLKEELHRTGYHIKHTRVRLNW